MAHTGIFERQQTFVAHSLRASGYDASEDGTGRGAPLVAAPVTACYGKQPDNSDSTSPNLMAVDPYNGAESHVQSTIGVNAGVSTGRNGVRAASGVRRLTPRECERLQGFPDDYTAIPYRGRPAADGPRYRALGNSMAVPVMRWIGKRIDMVGGCA